MRLMIEKVATSPLLSPASRNWSHSTPTPLSISAGSIALLKALASSTVLRTLCQLPASVAAAPGQRPSGVSFQHASSNALHGVTSCRPPSAPDSGF